MLWPTLSPGTHSTFRFIRAATVTVGLGALAAACSQAPPDQPREVGNMAYPAPLPRGDLSTTNVAGRRIRGTGNMAYPEPRQTGVIGTLAVTRQPFDTGNMAYPEPLLEGNVPKSLAK